MMLRYSFDLGKEADMVEQAVANVLAKGLRTPDIAGEGADKVSTTEMGDAVIAELEALSA